MAEVVAAKRRRVVVDVAALMAPVDGRNLPHSMLFAAADDDGGGMCTFRGGMDRRGRPCGEGVLEVGTGSVSAEFTGGSIADAKHARIATGGKTTLQCAEIRGGVAEGPFSYTTTQGMAIDGRFVEGGVTCETAMVRAGDASLFLRDDAVVEDGGGHEVTYRGGVAGGLASGRGDFKCGEYAYEGEWHDGVPHGMGTERSAAETYVGGFVDGARHGEGRILLRSNDDELYCEHEAGRLVLRCTMSERELALTRRLLNDALEAKDATEEACRREMDVLRAECERQAAAHRELLQCKVCFAKPSTTAIVPCGHICLCEGCAEEIGGGGRSSSSSSSAAAASSLRPRGSCPICRRTFTRVMNVFLQ